MQTLKSYQSATLQQHTQTKPHKNAKTRNKLPVRAGADFEVTQLPFAVQKYTRAFDEYHITISDVLNNLSDVEEVVLALYEATEQDKIVLHLNCDGGACFVGDALTHAMRNCVAPIHCIATGRVASYATFVIMEADTFEMSPFTDVLCHSPSYGSYGKSQDVKEHVQFVDDQIAALVNHYYKDFLTPAELEDMIKNKREIYMTAEQFTDRINARAEKFAKASGADNG